MTRHFDTLLLLALPASGKSEVRRYLDQLSPAVCRDAFHMGPTVQLDDFPYVHMMRRVDQERIRLGRSRVFFEAEDRSFIDPFDWGTLIQLVNEDYDALIMRRIPEPRSAALHLFERIDRAGSAVGTATRLTALPAHEREALADALEREARELLDAQRRNLPDTLKGKTVVIEFARGGPAGAAMPLQPPMGYGYSLSQLAEPLLATAVVLYIWVTPEESRRKNSARADPDDPGSILHHGVPTPVMLSDYGCDDIEHLLEHSPRPGTVAVKVRSQLYHLPLARFDNRIDKTSFLRAPREQWGDKDVAAVHAGLERACDELFVRAASTR